MGAGSHTGWVFLIFGAGVFIYAVVLQKGLTRLRDDVDRAWSQLDAVLREWTEAVQKLSAVSSESAQAQLAESLAEWREASSVNQKSLAFARSQDVLEAFLAADHGLISSQPDITPQLKAELADLQQRIQERRRDYNQRTAEYNRTIGQIPDAVVASYMGLQRRELFIVPTNQQK